MFSLILLYSYTSRPIWFNTFKAASEYVHAISFYFLLFYCLLELQPLVLDNNEYVELSL